MLAQYHLRYPIVAITQVDPARIINLHIHTFEPGTWMPLSEDNTQECSGILMMS